MPNSIVSLVVLAIAVSPGYVHHRLRNRFMLKDDRSTTAELVELFSAGALSTTVATVVVLLCGGFIPFLVTLNGALSGVGYIQSHPWQLLTSVLLVIVLSIGLSALSGWLIGRLSRTRVRAIRDGSVWVRALTRHYQDRKPYLAVELDDGRLVEGYLLAASIDEDPNRRDLILQGPLAFTGPGDKPRTRSSAAFVMVPGRAVRLIHAQYVTLQPTSRNKPDQAENS